MQRITVGTPYIDAMSDTGGAPTVAGRGKYWRVEIVIQDGIDPLQHPDVVAVIAAAKAMIRTEYGIEGVVSVTRGA